MNQITDTVFEKLMDIDKYEIEEVDKNDDKDEFIEEYFNTGSHFEYYYQEVDDYTMRDMCSVLDYVNKKNKDICSEPYDFTNISNLLNLALYYKAEDLIKNEWERVKSYLEENRNSEDESEEENRDSENESEEEVEPAQ